MKSSYHRSYVIAAWWFWRFLFVATKYQYHVTEPCHCREFLLVDTETVKLRDTAYSTSENRRPTYRRPIAVVLAILQ